MAGEPRFDSRWFQNTPPEEVEDLKSQLVSHKKTLDKLREIVYNMCIREKDIRTDDYDSPSWANKQAHLNGKQEAFRDILRLTNLESNEVTLNE